MPKPREIIDQIIEVRERRQFNHGMGELFSRLSALESAFEQRRGTSEEMLKYFPVALVACMEGYFRLTIEQLIDKGQPFLDNGSTLISNTKFNFRVLKALNKQEISIGELISHHISLNNLEQINSNITAVVNVKQDFLSSLRIVSSRWEHEILGKEKMPILQDPDQVYKGVSRTFELRHVICHELASEFVFDPVEIEECFLGTVLFLKAADELINEILHPDAPLTQAEMDITAGKTLKQAKEELDSLNEEICNRLQGDRVHEFMEVDSAWQAYMKLQAEFEANAFKGGNIWPTIYAGTATTITLSRINEAKKILDKKFHF